MKGFVKRLLRWATVRLGYHNLDHLTFLLSTRLKKKGDVFILQVGANDGSTYDPIHEFVVRNRRHVKALMLEPVSDFYEQLVATYRGYPGIVTLQRAIHATNRFMDIYRVSPEHLGAAPEFTKGIASFDPQYHAKSSTPSEWIVAERVECVSMGQLLETHGIREIDLLCIDTEGYDSEILASLDLEIVRPVIIMFEHGLRDGVITETNLAAIVRRLNRYGYDVMIHDYDVIAHLREKLAH